MPQATHSVSCTSYSVSCLGQEFRPGVMVCVQKPSDSEYPVFGEVQRIVVDDIRYLAVELYSSEFSFHYFAYKVSSNHSFQIVPITKLALHRVYHKYNVSSYTFVIRSCDHIELLI